METESKLASNIHFCEKGGNITCCFSNVRCVKDFLVVNDKVILHLNWLLFEIYHAVYRLRSFLSSCHPVIWSFDLLVIRSFGHSVIQAFRHLVTRSLVHSVTWSLCHSVTRSFGYSVTQSPVTRSLSHSVT